MCSPGRVRESWVRKPITHKPAKAGDSHYVTRTSLRRNLFIEVQDVREAIQKAVDDIDHPRVYRTATADE
jgi:hypothetical protein